jgi:hypothetical protein
MSEGEEAARGEDEEEGERRGRMAESWERQSERTSSG